MVWALEVGGAERFLVKLVQNIPKDEWECKVVCLSRKGVWARELENQGIEVISMDKRTGMDARILFRLRSLIKKQQPDLVNTHLWTADLWGRLAAILAGVKHIVVTEQNVDLWKKWHNKWIDKFLFRWTERVICVADQVARFYHDEFNVPKEKIAVIPNAIDLSLFDRGSLATDLRGSLGVDSGQFVFVCAARLHPQKAHHVLIDATTKLVGQGHKNFRIWLAGDGQLRQQLEECVKEKCIDEYVRFLGIRQDIAQIFMQSDCFVLSSDYEGLPLAILEAMAAGLPIVATHVGGNSQVVETGKNGILVPPRDPTALADAMKTLIDNRDLAREMGNMSRALVEREFSIEMVAEKTTALFKECLG